MMKKSILKRTAAVCAAAALLTFGGLTVSAAAEDTTAPATVTETVDMLPTDNTVVTVPITGGEQDDYDIVTLDTGNSSEKQEKNWGKIILIAVIISIIGTGLIVYFIYRGYKYNGMTEPYEFKNKAPLELKDREDALIDVHVTTRRIERNNNN